MIGMVKDRVSSQIFNEIREEEIVKNRAKEKEE